jgi:hypothetical protein
MRFSLFSIAVACLLAAAGAASAGGERGHTLGADTARLSAGAGAIAASAEQSEVAEGNPANVACGAGADAGCALPDDGRAGR